jgi:tyrosinase
VKYAQGVNLLKNELTGPTTQALGIPGPSRKVSTYDLFVVWHQVAMMTLTPPAQGDRNAAHSGPVFAPWHRFMLRQLELNLQRVLNDNNFGLPYWDWAADGQLSSAKQKTSKIWAADCMGNSGSPISTGPFVYKSSDPKSFRVRIDIDVNNQLRQVNRGLSPPALRQLHADARAIGERRPY